MTTKKEIVLTKDLARRLQKKFPSSRIYANKCPSRGNKIKARWKEIFNEACPPLQPEIDLIFLESQSSSRPKIRAVEIKYFKKRKGRINQSFYKGIEQPLALLQWGFDNVALWQLFDESFSDDELRDYGCRTWFYIHETLDLPIEFTPIQIVSRGNRIGFQIIQADWSNNLTPIRLLDIDNPNFQFSYTHPNPLAFEGLRRAKFKNWQNSSLIQKMFREIDTLRDFMLEWLPEQETGLAS